MSLSPGTRLGVFEIVAPLGEGGMGQVYRARDTRLGREVALKVLPDLFAQDADRLSRFQREAQLLASLSHPHIGAIHGLEDIDGIRALVLELIEGETLAERIARGALPVEDALAIARQIADALEAAHERGVIHRDLKPANIKITPDGKVKVLDFGLAKAMETTPAASQLTHSPTLSLAGTFAGVILGTASYMSPEQAKGLPADQRSDVFSFGCVVYEMLTGRQAFQGDSATEILAAVLMRDPDLTALPPALDPRLAVLVRRCLEKQPKRRWQAIGDVRYELDAISAGPIVAAGPGIASSPPMALRQSLWSRLLPVVVTAIVVGSAAGIAVWGRFRTTPGTVTRFAIVLDEDRRFVRPPSAVLALSLDGTRLVYSANRQLYLRSMADTESRPIAGTNLDVATPFFSPDGQWIGFFSYQDSTLKKIAITGGAALTLCKIDPPYGASWENDQIVFAEVGKGIMRVSADGGEPQIIAAVGTLEIPYGPHLIDRGTALLYTVATAPGLEQWDKAQIVVQSLGSTERKVLLRGGSDARYLPTGHLVYALGTSVLAIPFDLGKRAVNGGPVPILEGVMRAPNPGTQSGVAHFATSANGVLAYVPGTVVTGVNVPKSVALVDSNGKTHVLPLRPQAYSHPRVSSDGTHFLVATDDGNESVVWVGDLKAGGPLRRLTFGGRNRYPIWSPEGRFVYFQSDRDGDLAIFRQPADGSGGAERVTKPDQGTQHEPESWSPDRKTLSMDVIRGVNQGVWTMSSDGDHTLATFMDAPNTTEKHSVFSPDGRWLAYMSTPLVAVNSSGGTDVFVQPFPATGAKYQISSGGGRTPLWSPDGRRLFYHEPATNRLVGVDVRTQPAFTVGKVAPLAVDGTIHPLTQRNYDITPDGKQFLVILPMTSGTTDSARRSAHQVDIVLNWFEELKARVPTR